MASDPEHGASGPSLRHARLWLWLGLVQVLVVLVLALAPGVPEAPITGGDKLEHALTFLVLTAWFTALVRRAARVRVAAALLLLGAAIELAQGTALIGRDASWGDLLADALGIAAGLAFAAASRVPWLLRLERWLWPS